MWKRIVRWGAASIALLVALSCAGLAWLARTARQEPEFYTNAERRLDDSRREPDSLPRLAVAAQTQVVAAQEAVERGEAWSVTIRDDEANAWLTTELPKFAGELPDGVGDVRIAFDEGLARMGWKQATAAGTSVVSIEAGVSLARPGMASIQIKAIRLGGLALPREQILEHAREAVAQQGLKIEWTETDGEPTALLPIATFHERGLRENVVVETIELVAGAVTLSGRVN